MTTIYISSTYEDLKEFREVVYKALRKSGYDVIAMEDYVAADQRPVEKCLDDVKKADIYVGIFAFRYGYVPPETHGNPNKLSITELEFRHAETLKKPCLTFIVHESKAWPPMFDDARKAEDKGDRINRLRNYLLTEKMGSSFTEPYELASLVQAAIAKYLHDNKPLPVITDSSPQISWDIEKDGSPYPGLMHFTRKYARVFFGREAEVNEILDRMHGPEGRFVIVSGGSGTGKSSLVDAGVLPRLEETGLPIIGSCVCKRVVPSQGNHPFDSLMRVLQPEAERAGVNAFDSGQRLLSEPGILTDLLKTIISKGTSADGLILFLDQMEELFTAQCRDSAEPFLSALYRTVNEASCRVIATIRSDFLHHCHEHDDLLKVLRGTGHYPLGRLETYMLRDVIEKPARSSGLSIPKKLIDRLIRDAGTEAGSLPLLAFALEQLFSRRSGNALSEDAYSQLGGIAGAIGAHVDAAEHQIAKEFGAGPETWLPKIFQPLVIINIDGQPTRRRALKLTLENDLQPIVDLLSKERLLSTEGEGRGSTVAVAHEKLFEAWPSLSRWLAGNRDDLLVLRQAEIEAKEWVKHEYDTKYLWHIDRLVRLRDIVQRVGTQSVDPAVGEYVTPQDRLIERLHSDTLSHQERLAVGQYLAVLGDPRNGVGLTTDGLPDIEWVDIPAGKVRLEGVKNVFTVKKVFTVKLFRISRYLVTNIQFKAFVDAEDGYRNLEWWADIQHNHTSWNCSWLEPNYPCTEVDWYEAVAFCRWLSARLGKVVRLPSEWEWQHAATGGDATNNYPWGRDWDAARCNSGESHLLRTTAVGVYPSGATKDGVLDMAGNVWEWCLNKYENPSATESLQIDSDLGVKRALRGGSWFNIPPGLRASHRFGNSAYNRFSYYGFRLAQDID
jgi:formylglycine-generating enzyme required for sulfatase activity